MKKLILSLTALATIAFAFTSCEDVPMPYGEPTATTDTTTVVVATGTGTADDPYNVAKAMQIIKDGSYTSDPVYVKGVIVGLSEFNSSYGNYTYYINDTQSTDNQLEIYRGKGLNQAKFTSESDLKIGDVVVVYGALTSYNGTAEMTSGNYLYSLNGEQGTPITPAADPKGTGTEADPFNVAAAAAAASALDASGKVEGVYVSGIISQVGEVSMLYGNATYYISDDGTTANQFEIYRGYYLNGEKFTLEDQIKVGDKVVVKGDLINFFGNTIEMTQGSQIVSLNGNGGTTTVTGLNATFSDGQDGFTINDVSLGEGATYVWQHDATNHYMKAAAYINRKNIPCVSQLVSPAFSLEGLSSASLSFQHTARFFGTAADELKVLASTDKTNWTELSVSAYPDGTGWTFVDATCDLGAFAGQKTVYIAFQYTSTAEHAATWEIKNVVVK